MKKLFAMLLVLSLLLAMSAPAFAEEGIETVSNENHTTTVTITNSDGRTFVGYQLLDLTTSLKGEAHHPQTCNGVDHADDCYNYAYTVNAKYRAILQAETLTYGRNELFLTGRPATAAGVTDEQILAYLSGQTGPSTTDTMRQVADRLYRAILDAGIEADAASLTGTNDVIDQGYWMFADISVLTGNEANSLVMVDTAGEAAITINPKTALPVVEKKVKDIEDSEDDSILDNAWHDSADHDVGDTVPFKLTATLPSNAQFYTSFTMIFHDSLSAGLTLNPDSFKVYMYDTKHKADVDTDLNDYAKDVTDNFAVKTSELGHEGCSFEIGCDNVFAIEGVTKDTAFVVYYEATLNENAVIGSAGNPNEVYLEYSNNPYGTGTGMTEKDKVTVFTYKFIVNKVDSHGHELEGAGFTLYKKDITGTYHALGEELIGEAMTTFTWSGLDDGDYKLVETTVPAGYNKMADVLFSISAAHEENSADPELTLLEGGVMGAGVVETGIIEKDIVNHTGTILPETGAQGTFLLIFGGAVLAVIACVFMITRKKMSVYED